MREWVDQVMNRHVLGLCVLLIGCVPVVSMGQSTVTPYAAENIVHDSNIFDLSSSGPSPVGKNGPTFEDTYLESRAGIDGTYLFDRQKLYGTAEFRRFVYDNFTSLDHNEYMLDGGLRWKLLSTWDGALEYRHEQRMVQFLDLAQGTDLILETENNAEASANVTMTPEWRLESRARYVTLDSPRADIPGLSLQQDSLHEGLRYLGVSNLSAGIDAEYLKGKFLNDPTAENPNYHQSTVAAAATYIVSGFTNFTGYVGYTNRTDPTNSGQGLSGVTGNIIYQHSLTGKTSVNVQLARAITSYVTTGGTELDTSAAVSLNWQATYKIAVKAGYSYIHSEYPQTPDGGFFIDRIDHFQIGNLEMDYQVLRWLSIRTYGRYQTRHSTDVTYTFNGTMVGIELVAKKLRPNQ